MQKKHEFDAVVVGSGPNGLAAAITIARAGYSVQLIEAAERVGGGMRSSELTIPGFIHDICSAIHPLGIASPFFRSLNLAQYGLNWVNPPTPLAHPMDDGTVTLLERTVEDTALNLGNDGKRYRQIMKPLTEKWEPLINDLLRPLHMPRHPLLLASFGRLAISSAEHIAKSNFASQRSQALIAGLAAHSILPLDHRGSATTGLLLAGAAHTVGWPVASGGSQAIAVALAACLTRLGGKIQTGRKIASFKELPSARVSLLDVTPRQFAEIMGDQLMGSYREKLAHYRYGPGVFKMDWALDRPIPWHNPECLKSATVHLGGTFEEITAAESTVWCGQIPEKPLVILAQQSLFDTSRAPAGKQIAWAYCHVPNSSTYDMSERIEAQVERFAPGFKDVILERHIMNTLDMETYNQNYVGGDISGGIQNPFRLLLRPWNRWKAYTTPVSGVYICSSSMPPGGGVHGMCGYHAAQRALHEVFH